MKKETKRSNPAKDCAAIKAAFAAGAKLQVDTILTNLPPLNALQPAHMRLVQLAMWRTAVSMAQPIVEAIDSNATIRECRDLAIHMNNVLIAAGYEIEKAIAAEYIGDECCRTCGGNGGGLFPAEEGLPMCAECAGWEDVDE